MIAAHSTAWFGLIPAHAGKTVTERLRQWPGGAHPRSRGENHGVESRVVNQTGSSPLTQGKHEEGGRGGAETGLISAHAGKTRRGGAAGCRPRAHPRSRGENSFSACLSAKSRGSSPLTRGKPRRRHARAVTFGLIPAHAGKTYRAIPRRFSGRAHPRSRGENPIRPSPRYRSNGSSPLTRGKQETAANQDPESGLIPAHAGKTEFTGALVDGSGAHPRSRGENLKCGFAESSGGGSSPLTRGKLVAQGRERVVRGLIPAHAGKTSRTRPRARCARAHPRSRGENMT